VNLFPNLFPTASINHPVDKGFILLYFKLIHLNPTYLHIPESPRRHERFPNAGVHIKQHKIAAYFSQFTHCFVLIAVTEEQRPSNQKQIPVFYASRYVD